MESAAFTLPPEHEGRLWLMDLIHNPRALPPLAADLQVAAADFSPLDLDQLAVNGYLYGSPRSMAPQPEPPALPPGQALRNWEDTFFPATRRAYEHFRHADYDAMDAPTVLAFIQAALPNTFETFANTIVSAMQLGPDADRLYKFLEGKLGAEADLLSAAILHGSGSQTRSLGDEVQALAEAARNSPGVESALRGGDYSAAAAMKAEPWASALKAFIDDHEDELALWSEIHVPAWNEDPVPLMRQVAATLASPGHGRRDSAAAVIDETRQRLAAEDLAEFEAAIAHSRDYVPVIEHRARWQLKLLGGGRRTLLALGQKLVAANVIDEPNDIFFLHLDELDLAASTSGDFRQTVAERKDAWQAQLRMKPPMTLGLPIPIEMVGMMSPMLRRMFGAVALPEATETTISGIGANKGVVRGRARIVRGLDEAEDLVDGDILVCPSTSPPWTPYFAVVSAIVTDAGGVLSHAAIEAREYGIPAVVGTREGTRRIPEGATITVDGEAGTVTIEP